MENETGTQRVGIIGLGNMGGRVAQRIYEQGLPIIGYDRDVASSSRWDLPAMASVRELVEQSDVVLLSLPNSAVIEAVIFDTDGVLDSVRQGQTVVDLSTASPTSSRKISEALASKGVDFVDGGLTGGVDSAATGTMTVMVGGDEAVIERMRPVLAAFSVAVHRMGPSGSGHVAKVFTNFLNGVALAATSEVMVAAKLANLDLEALLEVFNHGSAINWATRERFPQIIRGDYMKGGLSVDLMIKDVGLYIDVTRDLKAPTLMAGPCYSSFQLASTLGYGSVISNHVVDAIGDIAGGVRVQIENQEPAA